MANSFFGALHRRQSFFNAVLYYKCAKTCFSVIEVLVSWTLEFTSQDKNMTNYFIVVGFGTSRHDAKNKKKFTCVVSVIFGRHTKKGKRAVD